MWRMRFILRVPTPQRSELVLCDTSEVILSRMFELRCECIESCLQKLRSLTGQSGNESSTANVRYAPVSQHAVPLTAFPQQFRSHGRPEGVATTPWNTNIFSSNNNNNNSNSNRTSPATESKATPTTQPAHERTRTAFSV